MVLVVDRVGIGSGVSIILCAMISNLWSYLLSFGLAAFLMRASAADWPQFLGPTRNGVYTGPPLAVSWPKEGPPVVWQRKVDQGFSGPAVSSGKLILFHRIED